jgi:hypothetical protein
MVAGGQLQHGAREALLQVLHQQGRGDRVVADLCVHLIEEVVGHDLRLLEGQLDRYSGCFIHPFTSDASAAGSAVTAATSASLGPRPTSTFFTLAT